MLKAAERGAGLTRQLLAVSRRQVIEPKVLDLRLLLDDLRELLQRLLGEHIELTVSGEADLGHVKADPGQLEQVIMNLCVNARDAMPEGGRLRLRAENADVDADTAALHPPMAAGRYVRLAVTDTGCGIAKEEQSKIFEPFFTTKPVGKGTGLGLAMVYGIVKQAGGFVWVYSEVGSGTTIKVYLPRIDEAVTPSTRAAQALPESGTESILLVEDEESLRSLAREILTDHGYRVLEASEGEEAIGIIRRQPDPIHLLVTDVVMPGMNGHVLAETLRKERPDLKVLYMSGYTDDVLTQGGSLHADTLLLEKPFTAGTLLRRVREALSIPDAP
jgi:two-component system, cell cycle sensor histidine kinase and response regulator CckA